MTTQEAVVIIAVLALIGVACLVTHSAEPLITLFILLFLI